MNATNAGYYTITSDDVGKSWIKAFGRTWLCCDFIGRIFAGDVGKRVYERDGILQVENDEQLNARLNKSKPPYGSPGYKNHTYLCGEVYTSTRCALPAAHFGPHKLGSMDAK